MRLLYPFFLWCKHDPWNCKDQLMAIQQTKVTQLRTAKQKNRAQHRKLAEPILETTFLWTSSEMRKINPGYWSLCFVYTPLCAAEHSPNWCLFPQTLDGTFSPCSWVSLHSSIYFLASKMGLNSFLICYLSILKIYIVSPLYMNKFHSKSEFISPICSQVQQNYSQFSSVAKSCPTLCNPMDCSTPGFPVHHQILRLAQTHVH